MKKILSSMLIFLLGVYAMPVISRGTRKTSPPSNDIPTVQTFAESPKSYDESTVLSVFVKGNARNMTMHDYLCCVVSAEMPASFPIEALKAQAVAARTYALYKIAHPDGMHEDCELCDDYAHCAAFFDIFEGAEELWKDKSPEYTSRISAAVSETDGIVAVFENEPVAAVFHAASGDFTEAAANVWGEDYPYLVSVVSPGGADCPDYYGEKEIKCRDFEEIFKKSYPSAVFPSDAHEWFKSSERSEGGGIVEVSVAGVRVKGTELRTMLGLSSTNFKVEISGDRLVFTTEGSGHGVGMSQYGAKYMAQNGAFFDEIITHYYKGAELKIKKSE